MNNFYTKSEGNALMGQIYNTRQQIAKLQRDMYDIKRESDLLRNKLNAFKKEIIKRETASFICDEE